MDVIIFLDLIIGCQTIPGINTSTIQGGRGHWVVYYTSPQSLIISFSYSLAQQRWGLLLNFDWLPLYVQCPNVLTTNCNLQKG